MVTTSADHFPEDPEHETGVWLEEFTVPYLELRKRGMQITVASPKGGQMPVDPRSAATPEQQQQWAEPIAAAHATRPLDDMRADDFDAIFLPGGHGPMFDLPDEPRLKALLHDFDAQKKVVGALCHGPAGLLGATGAAGQPLVKDRRMTSYTWREEQESGLDQDVPFNLQQRLTDEGARFIDAEPRADHAVADRWAT